jgi:hypothetical protein
MVPDRLSPGCHDLQLTITGIKGNTSVQSFVFLSTALVSRRILVVGQAIADEESSSIAELERLPFSPGFLESLKVRFAKTPSTDYRPVPSPASRITIDELRAVDPLDKDSLRYRKVRETLIFYREHLNEEYQALSNQAHTTYILWVVCAAVGFVILIMGLVAMLRGKLAEGAVTAASTIIVYFIQRIFQQREDHYRTAATAKNAHLEFGNQWLLVIQTIEAIDDPQERIRQQAGLVAVLTRRLNGGSDQKSASSS